MTEIEMDIALGGTPCLCGLIGSWHPPCYAGKSQAEIDAAYKKVYAQMRVYLREKRKRDARAIKDKAIHKAMLSASEK